MKAIHFLKTGDLQNLNWIDLPTPSVGLGEALIQIKAARINKNDISNVMGRMPYTTLPRTPGRDYAGVVIQGPDSWIGQAVWGTGCENGFTLNGSHAELMKVSVNALSLKPKNLTFEQAANCGTPFMTAWHALKQSRVGQGTQMVIIGASGAVGHAASELAKAKGATVLCLVRKPHDAVRLASTGVLSAILPPESEEMTAELQALIKTHFLQGANVIFDTTGAWLAPSISCLAQHGCVAVIVAPGRGEVNISVRDLYRSGSSIEGVNSLLYSAQDCAQVLDQLRPLFEENKLKPAQNIQIHPLSQGISVYESMSQDSGGQHVLINQSE